MRGENHRALLMRASIFVALILVLGLVSERAAAEAIKVGTLKLAQYGPLFIAKEKGYF